MTHVNFHNKALVFPQIHTKKGCSILKEETECILRFENKARQGLLRFTTQGPRGMHLLDLRRKGELIDELTELREQADALNKLLTACNVAVDCLVLPVELTLDHETAESVRKTLLLLMEDLKKIIIEPGANRSQTQRYHDARNQMARCLNLIAWVPEENTDAVRAAIEESAELIRKARAGEPARKTPKIDSAIQFFMPQTESSFSVDMPF